MLSQGAAFRALPTVWAPGCRKFLWIGMLARRPSPVALARVIPQRRDPSKSGPHLVRQSSKSNAESGSRSGLSLVLVLCGP